jgi:hypothetical protein
MKTDLPPTLSPNFTEPPPSPPTTNLSQWGLGLSLVAPAMVLLLMAVQPG